MDRLRRRIREQLGGRIALREKLTDDLEWTTVYRSGGAGAVGRNRPGSCEIHCERFSKFDRNQCELDSQRSHTKVTAG